MPRSGLAEALAHSLREGHKLAWTFCREATSFLRNRDILIPRKLTLALARRARPVVEIGAELGTMLRQRMSVRRVSTRVLPDISPRLGTEHV